MRLGPWHGWGECDGFVDQGDFFVALHLNSDECQANRILASDVLRYFDGDAAINPDSEDMFAIIRTWINRCLDRHPTCKRNISGEIVPEMTRLPTRVIDVGPSDGSESPYLLETKGLCGKYIALSHCWGGHTCTMTTVASLHSHRQGIKFDTLSKTFQEAIVTTRKLNLRYIWIDSLCIIQDDSKDWLREALSMGAVFENAFCTIAATGAKDSRTGLFIGNSQERVRIPREPGRPELGYMYFRTRPPPGRSQSVDFAPLQSRGWVLQERILSRRIIHFAEDQVYWECDKSFSCEEGFRQHELHGKLYLRSDVSLTRTSISELVESPESYIRLQQTWSLILKAYKRCNLSRKTDKLIAIDGLAKRIQKPTAFIYRDGIWFDKLPTKKAWYGLAWFAGEKSLISQMQVIAPSWSWAAMDGEFLMYIDFISEFKGTATVTDVLSPISPEFPTLSTLILSGRMRDASRAERRYPPNFIRGFFTDCSYRFYGLLDNQGVEQGWVSFDDDSNEPLSFSCVEIARAKSEVACLFLVIMRATSLSEPVRFRRIGAGFCSLPSWFSTPNVTLNLI
jgi:hypothetical protein